MKTYKIIQCLFSKYYEVWVYVDNIAIDCIWQTDDKTEADRICRRHKMISLRKLSRDGD